ncbi:MAG: hypothetical protein M0Q95_15280 [Porticoccaceae bacterium]|nr:hypothetical protein [Porticoccaceae bacterium]
MDFDRLSVSPRLYFMALHSLHSHKLKIPAASGVIAIRLENHAVIEGVGNGNVTNAVGTFERSDGSESTVQSAAASLDLAANNFYREFSGSITVPVALHHFSNMQGSGAVHHLLETPAVNASSVSLRGF